MLVVIVAINAANVAGRYLLSAPISWAEEITLYLMIGAVFLASPAVTWDGAHIRMDILARAMPGRVRRVLEALADAVSFAVAVILAFATAPIVLRLIEFDQRSNAAGIPIALPQGAVPAGFALVALALVARELCGRAAEQAAEERE
jgi:C4-dicarboxylate transporter, DctQ subunit